MSKNKNAIIRYVFLDQLLSDQNQRYTCLDLTIKCNRMLIEAGYPGICPDSANNKDDVNSSSSVDYKSAKRLIQLDLNALQESPFNLEIDSSEKYRGAPIYRYKDPTRTLFSKQLSDSEKFLLKEVLNTLGKFSGIDAFNWLDDLKRRLEKEDSFGDSTLNVGLKNKPSNNQSYIWFEENKYLKNKDYIAHIFFHIVNKHTIDIKYKRFFDVDPIEMTVYPYMLKEYNNRWYLLCTPSTDPNTGKYIPDSLYNLPLDRFEERVQHNKDIPFIKCQVDINERYEEIVGITYYKEQPIEKIVFAVKTDCEDSALPYIETKPLHETQAHCYTPKYQREGYKIFTIQCRYNLELITLLSSYGKNIIVLSPKHIKDKIIKRLRDQLSEYSKLNQKTIR